MSPQAIAKYKDWSWNVIKLFQNYVHAQLLRAELMLHRHWKAKLDSLSCTCGPAFVKDGHKNLHGNAPCHHRPFQIRCQCPCDCVRVCLICECPTTISIEWQARSLGVFWVGRVFRVKWKSTQVLQCPRKSGRHIVVAVLCSLGLLMMPICHTLRCEGSCLCSWKLHCWNTFPQWDSCAGPQCAPKQPVIGWCGESSPRFTDVNCCSSTTSGVAVTETQDKKKWSKMGKTSPEDALSLSNLRFKI